MTHAEGLSTRKSDKWSDASWLERFDYLATCNLTAADSVTSIAIGSTIAKRFNLLLAQLQIITTKQSCSLLSQQLQVVQGEGPGQAQCC